MKKILIIVGTRPNFIKVTQFKKEALKYAGLEVIIAHTGQHYDQNMSGVFFDQFKLTPDYFLNVKADSVSSQIGKIIIEIDLLAERINPDLLIAVGDVNSTLCAAIVANKRNILLAHLESGLRSKDSSMPEENNRILTDQLADHYFVTEQSGLEHLRLEGKLDQSIHFVGNTMIDTLISFEKEIEASSVLSENNLTKGEFILFTMHRPSNVDNESGLLKTVELLSRICKMKKVVFPIHPRTIGNLKKYNLHTEFMAIENLILLEPLDYFAFQKLIANSFLVITDSGGIQEETTFKQIPCITIRPNTERPVTIEEGTNILTDYDVDVIYNYAFNEPKKLGEIPKYWDGRATQRIMKVINGLLNSN